MEIQYHNQLNKWLNFKTCHFYLGEEIKRQTIATFDLDFTLIKTKSGKIFAEDENDWEWWDKSVPLKLLQIYKQGYHIVIFSNQGEIRSGHNFDKLRYQQILGKINQVILSLENDFSVKVSAFFAVEFDSFRKPNRNMWDFMLDRCSNLGLNLSDKYTMQTLLNTCYFIGDAAGRLKPKDFSDSDKRFAQAIGIKFQTPDDYFK